MVVWVWGSRPLTRGGGQRLVVNWKHGEGGGRVGQDAYDSRACPAPQRRRTLFKHDPQRKDQGMRAWRDV